MIGLTFGNRTFVFKCFYRYFIINFFTIRYGGLFCRHFLCWSGFELYFVAFDYFQNKSVVDNFFPCLVEIFYSTSYLTYPYFLLLPCFS